MTKACSCPTSFPSGVEYLWRGVYSLAPTNGLFALVLYFAPGSSRSKVGCTLLGFHLNWWRVAADPASEKAWVRFSNKLGSGSGFEKAWIRFPKKFGSGSGFWKSLDPDMASEKDGSGHGLWKRWIRIWLLKKLGSGFWKSLDPAS